MSNAGNYPILPAPSNTWADAFPRPRTGSLVALAVEEGHISLLLLHYLTRPPPHSYVYDLIAASRDLLQTAYRSRQLHLALNVVVETAGARGLIGPLEVCRPH